MATTHSIQSTQTERVSAAANSGSQTNVGQTERIISIVAGSGLAAYGIYRRDWAGSLVALLGAGLLYRGASGHSFIYQALNKNSAEPSSENATSIPGKNGIQIRRSLTINRTPEELYTFWKQVEKTPLYTPNVESVLKTSERTSHWLAAGPFGRTVEWNSEILTDEPNHSISWHVHGKPKTANAGKVTFEPATGGRGTVVMLELSFYTSGSLNLAATGVGSRVQEYQTLKTLRQFKDLMEAGEIPTIKGQPTGKGRHK